MKMICLFMKEGKGIKLLNVVKNCLIFCRKNYNVLKFY